MAWLIAKGRISEAEKILERAARFNGTQIAANCLRGDNGVEDRKDADKNVKDETNDDQQNKKILEMNIEDQVKPAGRTYTLLDLVRTPNLRKITICTSLLWYALNPFIIYII